MLVLPTGAGKTYTAVHWILKHYVNQGVKVLWIAHRSELLRQAAETFYEDTDRSIVNLEYGNNTYIIMFNDNVIGHNVNGGGWEYTEFSNYNISIRAYGITYAEKYKRFYLIYLIIY